MLARRLCCAMLAAGFLLWAVAAPAQTKKSSSRDILLQSIGMLAGQGLVLGHEALAGIAARYEAKTLPREQAEQALADAARYAELVVATFKGRLMSQLSAEEKRDLALLIGFYEVQREAIASLAAYVRDGEAKSRQRFEADQERVSAIIRQISLGVGAS